MVEIASVVLNRAKRSAAEKMLDTEKIRNAKQDIQRAWLSGELAEAEALYEKTERVKKSIDSAIDAYRTLISYEKEQIRKTQ
jgi:uncharacterized protein YecT (DUF1311 family)